jgi:hypothetical protein
VLAGGAAGRGQRLGDLAGAAPAERGSRLLGGLGGVADGEPDTDRAGAEQQHLAGRAADRGRAAGGQGGRVGVAVGAGGGVGAARVDQHGPGGAGAQPLPRPADRRGGERVDGEASRRRRGLLAHDQRQVGSLPGDQAGVDPGGPEPPRRANPAFHPGDRVVDHRPPLDSNRVRQA